MKHIFFVEDFIGESLDLIPLFLEIFPSDAQVHLLLVGKKEYLDSRDVQRKNNDIKNMLAKGTHYPYNKTPEDVYDFTPIPYEDHPMFFYDSSKNTEDIIEAIDKVIIEKSNNKSEPFAVIVDMALFGSTKIKYTPPEDRIDTKRIGSGERVLSHYICEKYLGQCGLITAAPDESEDNANIETWKKLLSNPHNKCVPMVSRYNRTNAGKIIKSFYYEIFKIAKPDVPSTDKDDADDKGN